MAERLLPGAVWKPISYRLDAPKFSAPPLGYIVHVPVSNGSLFNYFNGLKSPGRKFSHAWIPKKDHGKPEQYQSLDRQSWAQADGNPLYWAFEVEGFPGEPMDDAQLDTLATWHRFLGVADRIATAPGQKGIGTHSMGGAAWGGHSCPGTIRTAQLPKILDRLQEDDMAMTPAERAQLIDDIATAVVTKPVPRPGNYDVALGAQVGSANVNAYRALQILNAQDPAAMTAAVTAAVKAAQPGVDVDALAKAIVLELGKDN